MQTTIGLDFGTHQTKICVENINGYDKKYSFKYYLDNDNQISFVLPSTICIDHNNKLHYGFIPSNVKGRTIRYFKQATFTENNSLNYDKEEAILYSCWYIAYILFDLEKEYGTNFSIQMGVPTDSSHHEAHKQLATRILLSAYRLVEEVYQNNKSDFLDSDLNTLKAVTTLVDYSPKLKYEYGIMVLPEAYACIMPLTSKGKISRGINLLIDIGGGTTDISLFTTNRDDANKPRVYYFTSVNKAINYLTDTTKQIKYNSKLPLIQERRDNYEHTIWQVYKHIEYELYKEFNKQVRGRDKSMLSNILNSRPLIYCGGGSTYKHLLRPYGKFNDVRQISKQHWQLHMVDDSEFIENNNLYPLLSTAYGLSMATQNDEIEVRSLKELFEGHSLAKEEVRRNHYSSFDYGLDYDALK